MAQPKNERITENIVRDELRRLGYDDNKRIIVEEQKSAAPRIQKLLEHASKKGGGVVLLLLELESRAGWVSLT